MGADSSSTCSISDSVHGFGKAAAGGLSAWVPIAMGEMWMKLLALGSAWFSPGSGGHLGHEPTNETAFIVSFSPQFQLSNKYIVF